jgi:prevent-host-death family protein
MRTVSATEAKQNLGALLDSAQSEPVVIRRQKRDIAVIISAREYDRLRAINLAEFNRFCDRIGGCSCAWSIMFLLSPLSRHAGTRRMTSFSNLPSPARRASS